MEWAKNIEGEWDKKAKIDEDYQKVLEKIKNGKELSEDDVKKIEAYKKRYTNRELPETVQVALDKHKQAIEDKKLKAEAKEESEEEGIPFDINQSIMSGLLSGGVAFFSELVKSKVTDKAVEKIIKYAWETLAYRSQNMQNALVGALVGGGTATIPINVNPAYSRFVSGVAKYGVPLLGAAVDYSMQVDSGTDPVDASIKTGAHVTMGLIGAAVGKVSGAAVTTALGSTVVLAPLAPIAGVVTDFVVTSVILVGGSMIFDAIYDNKDKIAKWGIDTFNSAKDIVNGVGDAISGALSGLGSVLG